MARGHRGTASLLCALLLAAACGPWAAAADQAAERGALQQIASYLSKSDPPVGWSTDSDANPCDPFKFTGVACNADGSVESISLAGTPLVGSLPDDASVWGALPALSSLDMSSTGLGGAVPASLASAPSLTSVNLANNNMEGEVPALPNVSLDVSGNPDLCGSATLPECGSEPTESPAPSPSPDGETPTDGEGDGSTTASPSPAPVPSPSAPAPTPNPAPISNAAVCTCALKGFSDSSCQSAFAAQCSASSGAPPSDVCSAYSGAGSDAQAAQVVASYLQGVCFAGQAASKDACACAENAQSSDCAKGRVGLCAASDPACLAFQSYSDPASAQTLASYLSANCPVPLAPGAGVLATLRFADTSVSTYLSSGYEQGVANALAGAAGVPSSDVQTLDVRPVVGRRRRARALLQSGAGVQATYYVASSDPDATLAALKTAADDGSLTNALNANGISGTPTATLQAIYASDSSSGLPTWAIAVIAAVAGVVALAVLGALLFCCLRRRKAAKAAGPYYDQPVQPTKSAVRDPVVMATAGSGTGRDDLPVSKSVRVNNPLVGMTATPAPAPVFASAPSPAAAPAAGAATLTPWEAAPAPLAPVRTKSIPQAAAPYDNSASRSISGGAAVLAAGGAAVAAASMSRERSLGHEAAAPAAAAPVFARQPSQAASVGGSSFVRQQSAISAGGSSSALAASDAAPMPSDATSNSMTGRPSAQQAERAKFWAQFQETWQQVRETKKVDAPTTPSSGTAWSESAAGSPKAI